VTSEQAARHFYVDSFVRRTETEPADALIHHDGIYGTVPTPDAPMGRLLVVDDSAEPYLRTHADEIRRSGTAVFADAARCVEFLAALGPAREEAHAMVCRDLATIPELPLPAELTVQNVQRLDGDPPGVDLERATGACVAADPGFDLTGIRLAEFLRTNVPPPTKLFAAVDEDGEVRATSGSFVIGVDCTVIFVSTDIAWRGRGIGTAMTAHALRAAVAAGARQACLDASEPGQPIYERLGFEDAGAVSRFMPF
jgi:ribosomal protein S18 acetylase RimI-like enzyme